MLYALPIALVLGIYIAHVGRRYRLRKRIAQWSKNRDRLTDEAFYIALGVPSIRRGAAVSVRATVSDAVRIPKELIAPNDNVRELEKIGDPSHPSTVDFFEDVWSVASPEDKTAPITVRDLVITFGPQLK